MSISAEISGCILVVLMFIALIFYINSQVPVVITTDIKESFDNNYTDSYTYSNTILPQEALLNHQVIFDGYDLSF